MTLKNQYALSSKLTETVIHPILPSSHFASRTLVCIPRLSLGPATVYEEAENSAIDTHPTPLLHSTFFFHSGFGYLY
ncbi:hypothetical protein PM082_007639 [Marasmius tenuissimus]|nr:hypothetical protein PM082_007639 [Marasmius tenuissimus]